MPAGKELILKNTMKKNPDTPPVPLKRVLPKKHERIPPLRTQLAALGHTAFQIRHTPLMTFGSIFVATLVLCSQRRRRPPKHCGETINWSHSRLTGANTSHQIGQLCIAAAGRRWALPSLRWDGDDVERRRDRECQNERRKRRGGRWVTAWLRSDCKSLLSLKVLIQTGTKHYSL